MRLQVGVETGSQAVLDKYNKALKIEQTLRAVEICNELGVLSIIGNFIIGGADETQETLQQSIEFAERLIDAAPGRIDINTTIFTPYPGTPMYLHPEEYGLELLDRDGITGPGDNYPFHNTAEMNKWEIVEARQCMYRAVEKKMLSVLPKIPIELAEQHFAAFRRYGIRTRWFEFFSSHFNWYNYIGLPLFNSDVARLGNVREEEIPDLKPLRTVYLGTTVDGKFLVNAGHQKIQLGKEASEFFELCAGKLNTREILGELDRRGNQMSYSRAFELLQMLDRERLVVLSAL